MREPEAIMGRPPRAGARHVARTGKEKGAGGLKMMKMTALSSFPACKQGKNTKGCQDPFYRSAAVFVGKAAQAEPLLLSDHEGLVKSKASPGRQLARSTDRLIKPWEKWGKSIQADSLRARSDITMPRS
jgi:hypothetical protein